MNNQVWIEFGFPKLKTKFDRDKRLNSNWTSILKSSKPNPTILSTNSKFQIQVTTGAGLGLGCVEILTSKWTFFISEHLFRRRRIHQLRWYTGKTIVLTTIPMGHPKPTFSVLLIVNLYNASYWLFNNWTKWRCISAPSLCSPYFETIILKGKFSELLDQVTRAFQWKKWKTKQFLLG